MVKKITPEELAKELHEAGREAVEKNYMVNPNTHKKFLEWEELTDNMKNGRRVQAEYLIKKFSISYRV